MIQFILRYGVIAGLIVAIPMAWIMITLPADTRTTPSMLLTYVIMLVALSMVFVGIKQYRDKALGGVINFSPALGLGLAISAVAGVFYAAAWEVSQVFMTFDFADFYAKSMVENVRAGGGSPEEVAQAAKRASDFLALYSNPLFRVPMTFLEIFPVGVLVSLISAGLLRNSRFLPARSQDS
jgi:hypothetical protein